MAKSRRNLKKRITKRRKTLRGGLNKKTKRKCGCSMGNKFPPFFNGGKTKSKRKYKLKKRMRKSKKQKGGFFREIRNMMDYTYYLGEKQTATLGGYPQPKSPIPIRDQNPNSSA
jgi:hypothetical protein